MSSFPAFDLIPASLLNTGHKTNFQSKDVYHLHPGVIKHLAISVEHKSSYQYIPYILPFVCVKFGFDLIPNAVKSQYDKSVRSSF